ncbi:MAG: TraR/DksA C4-type zinc finger protein [Candidatus Acidiferrales bacterium]
MATNAKAGPGSDKYNAAEIAMMQQRDELIARITIRIREVRIDREPDDQAAWATDNAMKDLAVVTLERERRTLAEIEAALWRIKEGEYGTCRPCGEQIPDVRLQALPWARVCVRCAEPAPHSNRLAGD